MKTVRWDCLRAVNSNTHRDRDVTGVGWSDGRELWGMLLRLENLVL